MDDASGLDPSRQADGRFGPGNPGRRPGSRNRMSQRIALGLLRHFAKHEAEILERLSKYHTADYVRLIAVMAPKEAGEDSPEVAADSPEHDPER